MNTIDFFDLKGHRWSLLAPPLKYRTNIRGLTEAWMFVEDKPPAGLMRYAIIPHPVFTDWWPEEMSRERYRYLNTDMDAAVTKEEFALGWHYCYDWDGLLVNAYDEEGEGSCCTCYARKEDIV